MPKCRCGKVLTDLRSPDLLARWARREGDAWSYRDNGTPYWNFCVACHMREWPHDRRYNNASSRPAPPWLHVRHSGVCRLVAGDCFLTQPPLEVCAVSMAFEEEPPLRRKRPRTSGATCLPPLPSSSSGSTSSLRRCVRWPAEFVQVLDNGDPNPTPMFFCHSITKTA